MSGSDSGGRTVTRRQALAVAGSLSAVGAAAVATDLFSGGSGDEADATVDAENVPTEGYGSGEYGRGAYSE